VSRARAFSADAPAKLNRELRVGPRRGDGFHGIRSRFASIDLADRIEASESDRLELQCDAPDVPRDRRNLVLRAAVALAESLGVEARGRLTLVKRIPAGAGLGGGSSDAATTIRLLCRLWGQTPSGGELSRLAASLGSDVPFFLSGGEADVTGRGERVAEAANVPEARVMLLVPPFPIPTAEVYAAFDALGPAPAAPERLDVESSGRFLGPNDLERAVVAVRPEMCAYLETGRRVAVECGVTGSGSAIVLVGASAEGLAEVARRHPEARLFSARTTSRAEFRRATEPSENP
jgi:4-diphosphocytidyl-2-C-methyl-D-erythritol kinase